MEYFWILLIVIAASLIKGITGFGFALVALPPLLFWFTPIEIIPALILCNLFASVVIVLQKKERNLVSNSFRTLIVFGAMFTILGVLTLKYVSEDILITVMSVLFIILSVLSLVGVRLSIKLTALSYKIAGAFLGFLTGSISISGPPLALFLHSAHADNQEFREVFSWFSIVTAIIALVGYAIVGLLTTQTIQITLLFLPILYGGSYIGRRLNRTIRPSLFKTISLLITLFSCVVLLLK